MTTQRTLVSPAVDNLNRSCDLCGRPALTFTMVELCGDHWIEFFEDQAQNVRSEGAFETAGTWAANRRVQ